MHEDMKHDGFYLSSDSGMQVVRYHCPNESCHFEWKRISTEEQTANQDCPKCNTRLVAEES